MASSVFNGSLGSYSDGAYRKILRVPHTQAVVKIYKNRRSITIATYFQSRSSCYLTIKRGIPFDNVKDVFVTLTCYTCIVLKVYFQIAHHRHVTENE